MCHNLYHFFAFLEQNLLSWIRGTLKGTKLLKCLAGTTYNWKQVRMNFVAPAAYTRVVITFTMSIASTDRFRVIVYGQKLLGIIEMFVLVGRPEVVLANRFEETVARNRGINLHVFNNLQAAVDCLKR
jgi:hypothetical protein